MRITLTFDNGPDRKTTPLVLDVLAQHHILATFFVLGSKATTAEGRALLTRIRSAGHWIGNHTWSHRTPLGELDDQSSLAEVTRTHEVLADAGVEQRLFRPFGRAGNIGTHLLNPAVVSWLQKQRYSCVLWNCVPGDWCDPEGWLNKGLADCATRPWSLVVLHDLPTGAMQHLDSFIGQLKQRGASFVQEFPPDCEPIVYGEAVLPLGRYVADRIGQTDTAN
jgi:peptidoglycan-N-acetylglucosamine deacetylase